MKLNKKNIVEKIFIFIRPLWMWIRKISPKGAYIQLGEYRIIDPLLPKIDRLFIRSRNKIDKEVYELNSISAIRKNVKIGDKVVIVGGGHGVTGIVAMESGGKVIVIEASKDRVKEIRETWKYYKLDGTIIHGFVGSLISVWGKPEGAKQIEELPECDVLELDCEGAEKEILSNLVIKPRVIIVESHGHLGSPSKNVKNQLQSLGYSITDEMNEDIAKDIIVFVGKETNYNGAS